MDRARLREIVSSRERLLGEIEGIRLALEVVTRASLDSDQPDPVLHRIGRELARARREKLARAAAVEQLLGDLVKARPGGVEAGA